MPITLDGTAGTTTPALTNSALTSGRVTYAGTSGVLQDSANLTFSGSLLNVNAAATTPTNTPFVVKAANTSYAAIKAESNPNTGFIMLGDNATATESFGTASIGYSGAQFVLGGCVAGSNSVGGAFNSTHTGSFNGAAFSISGPSGQFQWWNASSATSTAVGSAKSLTQVMTLDANGNLGIGQSTPTTTERLGVTFTGNNNGAYIYNVSASPTGSGVTVNCGSPTGTNTNTCFLFTGRTAGVDRFYVYGNGGIANYQGNNVNLSDRREKTNFAPAKSYLDVICAIPVQTFNYIDQSEDDRGLTLGVVAQDVQAVAPELVSESDWGTPEEPKLRLSIYQTDLQYALMKAVQELTARVAALEAK